jgi:ubiquitin carboxyl-terminal hydrolase 7
LYPTYSDFQHFIRHKVPVEIRQLLPPNYPTLVSTELADDMTYEQVQKYVHKLCPDVDCSDRIRFSRHNSETNLPFFIKPKKKDRPSLRSFLASKSSPTLSKIIYFEVCPFAVTEIERCNSLQFEYYSDEVKPVSSHWVLLPPPDELSMEELLCTCASAAGISIPAQFLRLVDVWRGRIYNVFDVSTKISTPFEESAEYRLEQVPERFPHISAGEQRLIQFHHFSRVAGGKIQTHGDPFSLYVVRNQNAIELLTVVEKKLHLPSQGTTDWKLCLVQGQHVTEVIPLKPIGPQMDAFCEAKLWCANQSKPMLMAFIGLEHAANPIALKKLYRKEERSLRICN